MDAWAGIKEAWYNVSKKVFQWDKKLNEQRVVNSWYNEVKSIFGENGLSEIFQNGLNFDLKETVSSLKHSLLKKTAKCFKSGVLPKAQTQNFCKI